MAPMPNGRCRLHGGLTPAGAASPHTVTGKYSKDLPTRLLARYQEAEHDAGLLAMREEVRLVDARIADLLARVDTGESRALWATLRKALDAFGAARGTAKEADAWLALMVAVKAGCDDYVAWAEVGRAIDRRQRLVESERKRLLDINAMMSAKEAVLLVTQLVDVVRRHVTDSGTLAAIGAELGRILSAGDSGAASSGGVAQRAVAPPVDADP